MDAVGSSWVTNTSEGVSDDLSIRDLYLLANGEAALRRRMPDQPWQPVALEVGSYQKLGLDVGW